uniref:Uncharacterized protein n=1 Tax=Opuntia streptacantha TaxID=393608 RepID=A0A7C8YII8_OPUST
MPYQCPATQEDGTSFGSMRRSKGLHGVIRYRHLVFSLTDGFQYSNVHILSLELPCGSTSQIEDLPKQWSGISLWQQLPSHPAELAILAEVRKMDTFHVQE